MKRLLLKPSVVIPIALVLLLAEQLRGGALPKTHGGAMLSHVQRAPFQKVVIYRKEFVLSEFNHGQLHDVALHDGGVYIDADPRLWAITTLESNPVAQTSVDDAGTPNQNS